MIGEAYELVEADSTMHLKTNQVKVTPGSGKIRAYFNKGTLSAQYISREIPKGESGIPNYKILAERLRQPGDSLRNKLSGGLRFALFKLLDKVVKEGGECYCALYELNDSELIEKLIDAGNKIHLVLSNTGVNDGTNKVSRPTLHDSDVNISDRFLDKGHIGHNKFVVYVNPNGEPESVLTGSTNWTTSGLCAQSNNAILIESPQLAEHYIEYWKRLKDDGDEQATDFRAENNSQRKAAIGDIDISLWFSPNTKAKNKSSKSKIPGDLKEVFDAIEGAEKSILFLAFQPGIPSILEKTSEVQTQKPDLFIRGAATDIKAVESNQVYLFHRGVKDPVIVGAREIKYDFSYWMAELLKSSPMAHAIIHDKVMVIDAFTENCIVITGSHNLGYRASYNNDENLLIIRGDMELATGYATHILDVYGHYRWRYFLNKTKKNKIFKGLSKSPKWQEPYFNDKRGESIDTRFWL
jgi:phosphatidylserine/phosphatidylglycerophosphate/cardiolipin synthase-like enzyme